MKAYHENRNYSSKLPYFICQIHNLNFLAHWHTDIELIYVCEGSITVGINSESRVLHQGDIAICSSGDIHYYDSKNSTSTILLIIFHPSIIGCTGGWPTDIRFLSPFVNECNPSNQHGILPEVRQEITNLVHKIGQEADTNLPYSENIITGMLYELCGLLLRHVPSQWADMNRDKRRMMNMKIMQEVLDYLEANYMNGVTLEETAQHAKMSLFHFSRFFKNISGMNYIAYLNNLRVEKAEEMIMSTNKTMLEIALECGFTNVRTFNRVFRQIKNCRPTDCR